MEHSKVVAAMVVSNTLPNVIHGDSITVRNANGSSHHKGGLSGPILRAHNLKLIGQMIATGITAEVDIIGCGGVGHGDHVTEYLEAGCAGVQCTSGPAWSASGPRFFQQLLEGSERLQEYLFSEGEDNE